MNMRTLLIYLSILDKLEQIRTSQLPYESCRVTRYGSEYYGKVSETKSGHNCEYWKNEIIPEDKSINDKDFPDGSRKAARNFCRNPDDSKFGPWCYVMHGEGFIKENCSIQLCCNVENCKYTGPGMEYVGNVHKSVYENECQHWAAAVKPGDDIEQMLPEGSLMQAGKACRNPTGKAEGPWCYVLNSDTAEDSGKPTDTFTPEPCDIPFCFDGQTASVVTNEFGQQWELYYTHFDSVQTDNQEITISVKLWNPEDWKRGKLMIGLSVLAVPVTGKQLRNWDIGYEIIVSNIDGRITASDHEEESTEDNPGLLDGIKWSKLKISWKNGFIAVTPLDTDKPYLIHEVKPAANGIGNHCRIAGTGNDFMGTMSKTISGRECQAWTSKEPHQVEFEFLFDELFPERSAKNASNYCRDPSHFVAGPWCYTKDPGLPKDLCHVPDCYKPGECSVVVTMATNKKVFMLPEWRAHGLPISIKMWDPNITTSLILNIYPEQGNYSYQLVLGDDDNEHIKFYHKSATGSKSLLKQKTHSHFLSSGKWIGIIIHTRDSEINIKYEESTNPFFTWKKGQNEKLPAINAMYFSYEANSQHDNGSIGLSFPCDQCQSEVCIKEKRINSVFYPLNMWRENSTIVVKNVTFYARGNGVLTVNLFVLPDKFPVGKLIIDDSVTNNLMEIQFTARRFLIRVAMKYKNTSALESNKWTEITLNTDIETRNGSLWLDGSEFMAWKYPRAPIMYYFSVTCTETVTWTVNCKPPILDGKPRNGGWTPWSPWQCSVTCGGGRGIRRRTCTNPAPTMYGRSCDGAAVEKGICNENSCGDVTVDTINVIRKHLAERANNIEISKGESVGLNCSPELLRRIKDESPTSFVHWNVNGMKATDSVKLDTIDTNNFNYPIEAAKTEQNGIYACVVTKTDEDREVIDIFALTVTSDSFTVTTRVSGKVMFQANTAMLSSVYSSLRLTWYLNGAIYKEYDVTDLRLLAEETIAPIQRQHQGVWFSVVYQDQLALNWTTSWYNVRVRHRANWATYLLEADLFKGSLGTNEWAIYVGLVVIFSIVLAMTIFATIFIIRLQNYFKNLHEIKPNHEILVKSDSNTNRTESEDSS